MDFRRAVVLGSASLVALMLAFVAGFEVAKRSKDGHDVTVTDVHSKKEGGRKRDSWNEFRDRISELNLARQMLYKEHGMTGEVVSENERFLLDTMKAYAAQNATSLYNLGIFKAYSLILESHLPGQKDVSVLEIGPGVNLGVGFLFALTGAKKYYGLDIYMDPNLFDAAHYETLGYLLQLTTRGRGIRNIDEVLKVKNGKVEFAEERLEYLYPRQSFDIPLPDGSLDYVFSNASLEHVADPSKTIQAIYRVLKKGGVTAHQIDMRDHSNFERPLEFLRLDDNEWNEKWKDPSTAAWFLNRWRLSDFRREFESVGFRVLEVEINSTFKVDEAFRRTLAPKYQRYSLEDLSVTGARIIARKE